jgi:hypothetical protein
VVTDVMQNQRRCAIDSLVPWDPDVRAVVEYNATTITLRSGKVAIRVKQTEFRCEA